MRIYDYMKGILGAMGVGEDVGVPEPAWRIEEYLEAIYEAIKAGGGGGGGTDLATFLAPQFSSSTPYSAGDYVVKSGALYKFTDDHAAGAWTGTDAEQTLTSVELEALYAALSTKANVDGSYASMTVGNAEQLVSTVGIEDKVPYNFRTAGGSADIGNRETDMVVGGTIAWNQLIKPNFNIQSPYTHNGITYTRNADGSISVVGTVSGYINSYVQISNNEDVVIGHKYLVDSSSRSGVVKIWYNGTGGISQTVRSIGVVTVKANGFYIRIDGMGTEVNETINPQVYDLTQMFGSTIADYIYSLEQATAGAGVAWFKKLFPKPYYEYNAGTLMSVQAKEHNTVGFNAWDEEWDEGAINVDTGENYNQTGRVRVKNYIPILPNTTYYKKSPAPGMYWHIYYDADKNWVGKAGIAYNSTFTTPSNAYYMRSYTENGYGSTYNHDICINLSWDGEKDGTYEPYELHSYALDSSLTLRGIPKLDSDNKLYYDGDTYESDGTVTRKYGIVDLGTVSYTYYQDNMFYNADISGKKPGNGMIAQGFLTKTGSWTVQSVDENICWGNPSNSNIYFRTTTTYADAAAFKAAMSGVYLVYELATPTTEEAEPYQNPQIVDDFGTEEYVDAAYEAGDRDVAIPVGHQTFYQANLRAKLEMAPESPEGNGDYIVRQTDGENSYVPLVIPTELPTSPSTDGTYSLKVTVIDGTATLSWVADV